jgi:hypothetical protein
VSTAAFPVPSSRGCTSAATLFGLGLRLGLGLAFGLGPLVDASGEATLGEAALEAMCDEAATAALRGVVT